MRTSRLLALLLLAGALPLVNFGCHRGHPHPLAAVQVHISNCAIVTPDPTQTNEGDSIQWFVNPPDTYQYTITFTGASPVAHSFPSSSAPQRVTADPLCRANTQSQCTYKYSLTKITTPPSGVCIDPGVHVTPN